MKKNNEGLLSSTEVYRIAREVAAKHRLRTPDYSKMISEMSGKFPQPVVLANDNGVLWLDKYYVAFQLSGQADVRYVYITARYCLAGMPCSSRDAAFRNIRIRICSRKQQIICSAPIGELPLGRKEKRCSHS